MVNLPGALGLKSIIEACRDETLAGAWQQRLSCGAPAIRVLARGRNK